MDPGADQILCQHDQCTNNSAPCVHHPPGLPASPQGPFRVPYECLKASKARVSKLHLYQEVHPFLKWILGRTKAPYHRINPLTSVNLADTTLQACQEVLKDSLLPPKKLLHQQLVTASMMHLEQQVHPFLKWIRGRNKAPTNIINELTSVNIVEANLQACQELLKAPFLLPIIAWHL